MNDDATLPSDVLDAVEMQYRREVRRLEELQAEIQDLQERVKGTEHFLRVQGVLDEDAATEGRAQPGPESTGLGPEESRTDTAEKVLREAGQPMHYKKLWQELKRRGHTSEAQNPEQTLASTLSRNPKFVNTGRGMWDRAERRPTADRADVDAETWKLRSPDDR